MSLALQGDTVHIIVRPHSMSYNTDLCYVTQKYSVTSALHANVAFTNVVRPHVALVDQIGDLPVRHAFRLLKRYAKHMEMQRFCACGSIREPILTDSTSILSITLTLRQKVTRSSWPDLTQCSVTQICVTEQKGPWQPQAQNVHSTRWIS